MFVTRFFDYGSDARLGLGHRTLHFANRDEVLFVFASVPIRQATMFFSEGFKFWAFPARASWFPTMPATLKFGIGHGKA